jgi:beta-lactam-binding protein with PASTA domain
MPAYTNYEEWVTVPDVTKVSLEEAKNNLTEYGLRYEVANRRTHSAYPADYVIDQTPKAQSLVKPNRKIYLTVNTAKRAMVVVPELTDLSLRNAKIQLQNYGLKLGTISYQTARFKNSVLRQSIEAGRQVPKGTTIDLAVSDGLGGDLIKIPEIVGLRLSEAQNKLINAGLKVGEIRFEPNKETEPNTILSYQPANKDSLNQGQPVELVVSERYEVEEADESGAVFSDSTETAVDTLDSDSP